MLAALRVGEQSNGIHGPGGSLDEEQRRSSDQQRQKHSFHAHASEAL